jgi:hypothetical protein
MGDRVMTVIDPTLFQITVLAKALRLYAQHHIRVNSAYTPNRMLATAGRLLDRKFARGQYIEAAQALDELKERMLRCN